MFPDVEHEQELYHQGYSSIAGIDEAGRGCWAGPVVAAATILPTQVFQNATPLIGINDSKLLTAAQRDASYLQIHTLATGIGVGIVPAYVIDAFGIVYATRLAMMIALLQLPCRVDALLIDALTLPHLSLPQRALIKGDAQCLSIAAASIIAKVTRDRLMRTAEQSHPGYGFARHKGYGTALHQSALRTLGPCYLHRKTFRPVADIAARYASADI